MQEPLGAVRPLVPQYEPEKHEMQSLMERAPVRLPKVPDDAFLSEILSQLKTNVS